MIFNISSGPTRRDSRRRGGGEDGVKLGEIDIGELSFTPPDVDEAKALQIVIPVEITSGVGEGFEPDVYLEYVFLREGESEKSRSTASTRSVCERSSSSST
jgi:hypothetical protein